MITGTMIREWIKANYSSIDIFVTNQEHYDPHHWGEAIGVINRIISSEMINLAIVKDFENTPHEKTVQKLLQPFQDQSGRAKKNVQQTITGSGNILDSDNASSTVTKEEAFEGVAMENERLTLLVQSLVKQNELIMRRLEIKEEKFDKLFKKYKKLLKGKYNKQENSDA